MAGVKKNRPSIRGAHIIDDHKVEQSIEQVAREQKAALQNQVKNTAADITYTDNIFYQIENRIASNGWFPFIALAAIFSLFTCIFGLLWSVSLNAGKAADATDDALQGYYGKEFLVDAFWVSFQVLTTAGFEDSIPSVNGLRVVYFAMIVFGLVVFAILVGFITDSVTTFMDGLALGRTKVAESNHTLILGWNEATIRVVIQSSLLRRQYQTLNEEKFYNLFVYLPVMKSVFKFIDDIVPNKRTAQPNGDVVYTPWFSLLERPSTSVAANDIVIMTDNLTKEEMHEKLEQAFAERGIMPRRTKIGQNVICRIGDPTNVNDLIRVGAHRAAAIVVMLTSQDNQEEEYSNGDIQNGATLRCVMALRHVLFTNPFSKTSMLHPEARIVLQMTNPCLYVDAACFKDTRENDVIMPMDLSVFLNSLMFSCATQPGLAKVLLKLLNFDGPAIRRRKAKNLRSGEKNKYGDCIGKTFGEMRKQFTKAIFIGIMKPRTKDLAKIRSEGLGLCPKPETIIENDDLLIFIGPRSNPLHDFSQIKVMDGYGETAKKLIDKYKPAGVKEVESLRSVLICGWRPVWEAAPERLKNRLTELIRNRLRGSSITFINAVQRDHFESLMNEIGVVRSPQHDIGGQADTDVQDAFEVTSFPGILIYHVIGNASKEETLEPVVMRRAFNTAIVLGTQADVKLNARSRDTRVLCIMLLLRKLWNVRVATTKDTTPMHIVGENEEDLTAKLALAPRPVDGAKRKEGQVLDHPPDFINTQAIYARALTQTLAYPLIAPAVEDLFTSSTGSCNVELVNVQAYVPLQVFDKANKDDLCDGSGTIAWGVVRNAVLQAKGERSICIGYNTSAGDAFLCPDHSKKVHLTVDDKLILLRRVLLPDQMQ